MEIKEIEYSAHFKRMYGHLGALTQKRAEQREVLFRKDPFDAILKTHKLHGKLKDFYSFSVDRKTRIVFRLVGRAKAVFLDVGSHDIYQ
ncbi:MAG: type II toxin-antitoxin system mRNA interferase toxin, RelE/StbE family [bacterium]|nr:type II toxin-antitoxin system mRNA interferase toxin, RelE/StbE family [bacterium]MDZ4299680.1 type II toxin-antitoxin system mRNA interferase toxin, RelE/StbE family [Candidatus Sungbacteria bacterium]